MHHDCFLHCALCLYFYVMWTDMSENKQFVIVIVIIVIRVQDYHGLLIIVLCTITPHIQGGHSQNMAFN